MVATRRTSSSGTEHLVLSRVQHEAKEEAQHLREAAAALEGEDAAGPSSAGSPQQLGGTSSSNPRHLQRAGFVTLFCYLTWFLLLLGGILAYEGEPILVRSRDLPLHLFDRLFRTAGSLLLFALWGVRATAARLLPSHFDRRANLLWAPVLIYLAQAVLRFVLYQLHVTGYILTPQRWARDNQSHPPHVMSDHVLLASAVHGGLACEALLPLLNWRHVEATGRGRTFLRAYTAVAGSLALLVSAECYFTARYFHPPGEIILAAALGLAVFQAPLLLFAARVFQAHHAMQAQVQRRSG